MRAALLFTSMTALHGGFLLAMAGAVLGPVDARLYAVAGIGFALLYVAMRTAATPDA